MVDLALLSNSAYSAEQEYEESDTEWTQQMAPDPETIYRRHLECKRAGLGRVLQQNRQQV